MGAFSKVQSSARNAFRKSSAGVSGALNKAANYSRKSVPIMKSMGEGEGLAAPERTPSSAMDALKNLK